MRELDFWATKFFVRIIVCYEENDVEEKSKIFETYDAEKIPVIKSTVLHIPFPFLMQTLVS